jgi:hypothetical protein
MCICDVPNSTKLNEIALCFNDINMPENFFEDQINLKFLAEQKKTMPKVTNSWKKIMGSLQCQRAEVLSGMNDFMKEEKMSMMILDLTSSQQ